MLPEPLIAIAEYPAPELAAEAKERLDAAGITSYVGGEYYRHHGNVALQVPESEAARALEVLEIEPPSPAPDARFAIRPACPDCGSDQTRPIPPYGLYSLIGAFAVGFLLCVATRSPIGIAAILPGWLLATWLSRDAGKQRCLACGRKWKA
ncbi:MAG: hypothetical protein ABI968_03735 [Acidobacteriota bacterium]